MTKPISYARADAALRALDPSPTRTITTRERQQADATLARILATGTDGHSPVAPMSAVRTRRRRVLVPTGIVAACGFAFTATLGGAPAFASWTATPSQLTASTLETAENACRTEFAIKDGRTRLVLGERRGGWTLILLAGDNAEGVCLMRDKAATEGRSSDHGFFGSFTTDATAAPKPAREGVIQTDSMGSSVETPSRVPFRTRHDWFAYVSGHAGADVTSVIVHPPVGPDVTASLVGGRFAAWWPAGPARGENPGVGGGWTYTVTLADGTTRDVNPRQ